MQKISFCKKKNHMWFFLVCFSWLPVISYTVGIQIGVTLGLYGTVVLLVFLFAAELCKYQRISKAMLLCGLLSSLIILFWIGKRTYILQDSTKEYIYLVMILIMIGLSLNRGLTKKQVHLLYVVPCYITFIMAVFSFFPTSYHLGSYKNALYLNFQNPNILSFALLNIVIFELLGYMDEKRKCYLAALVLAILMLLLTHSRTSFMATAFLLLFFFAKKYWKRVGVILSVIISFIPVVVILIFTTIGNIEGISLYGKSGLSGRETIWKYVVDSLASNKKFLLLGKGIYMEDCLNPVYNNSHNAYLQLICNFGIPIFIIILMCIIFLNVKAERCIRDEYTFVCYFASGAILVNSSFEIHIAESIIGLTFMWILLYWINLSRKGMNDGKYQI